MLVFSKKITVQNANDEEVLYFVDPRKSGFIHNAGPGEITIREYPHAGGQGTTHLMAVGATHKFTGEDGFGAWLSNGGDAGFLTICLEPSPIARDETAPPEVGVKQ